MKEPIKPGSEASKAQEGGSLGNIDEQTGHPGKGTGGPSIKPEENGNNADQKSADGQSTTNPPVDKIEAGEEKNLYDRLAEKDETDRSK